MKIIEALTYERFAWSKEASERYVYICVPITLLIMKHGDKTKTEFIFWN
jgi:hypothetical protein